MLLSDGGGDGLKVIEHFLAGGELLSSQLPSASSWSPEKKLAAAIFSAGLAARDRRWIYSDNAHWPFSFLRLCELFNLEPSWVRQVVRSWENGSVRKGTRKRFRHAA